MSITFDIGDLEREIAALRSHPHVSKLAIVLPIAEGKRETAEELLAEGPPFDLARVGLDAHEVFLTESEAIFVFGLADGQPDSLEAILAEEDFWSVVKPWEHVAAGLPRVAAVTFDWRAA